MPTRSTEPISYHVSTIGVRAEIVTDAPAVGTPHPVSHAENKHSGEGRRNNNPFPVHLNRRRPPHRRRKPPMRRVRPPVHPSYHSSHKDQTTVPPTTTTMTTTTMITTTTITTTTTTTTTTTPVLNTMEISETLSAEYQTEEDAEFSEEYNNKDINSLGTREDLRSETTHATNDLDSNLALLVTEHDSHVGSSTHNTPSPNEVVTPKIESLPYPTQSTDTVNQIQSTKHRGEITITQILERERNNKNLTGSELEAIKAMKGQEKHLMNIEGTEVSKNEGFTHNSNTHDATRLTTQSKPRPNTQPSLEQNQPTKARTSSSPIFTSNSTRGKTREEVTQTEGKAEAVPETHIFPIMEPVHPWLRQKKQGTGQTTPSRTAHRNRHRNTGQQGEMNPDRHSQPPGAPPMSHWPSHHHTRHYFPLYPSWTGQSSFPHPRHGK